MVRIVLNRISQIPHTASSGTYQILHRPILQEGSFKRALLDHTLVVIGRSSGPGPDLGDIAIAAVQPRQTRFRTDDAPRGIVHQTVRRHVASHVSAVLLVVVLDGVKYLLKRAAIEEVHQLCGSPSGIWRTQWVLPSFMIVFLPFALEPLSIPAANPEFGFFEMNGFDASLQRSMNSHR